MLLGVRAPVDTPGRAEFPLLTHPGWVGQGCSLEVTSDIVGVGSIF